MTHSSQALLLTLLFSLSICCCRAASYVTISPKLDAYTQAAAADKAAALAVQAAIDKPAIVTIGDSITAFGGLPDGWVNKLGAVYGMSFDIVNKGVRMGSSRSGVILANALTQQLFPGDRASQLVKLVTICYGANDASTNRKDPSWRMISLEEFTTNLLTAVRTLKAAHVSNILLITPPPASPKRVDRKLAVTAEYAAAVKAVAKQEGLPVADLFSAVQKVPDWENQALQTDGLHLTALGNEVLFKAVIDVIKQRMPKQLSAAAVVQQMGML